MQGHDNRFSSRGRPDAPDNASGTLASAAYVRLRQDIVAGIAEPGSRLHIKHLCDQLGMGLSPVREALNRLSAEGLVLQFDQRGFRVAPLDLDDLRDLIRTRCWLNEAAIRAAIALGDQAWEDRLVLAHHRLMRAPRDPAAVEGRRDPAWEKAHRLFHSALIAGCGSPRMLGYCEELFDAADRYRFASRIAAADQRCDEAEHTGIMEAVLRRDADAAVAALTAHMLRTEELVRDALSGDPERSVPARSG